MDRDGRDAMMLAAKGGHIEVCAWLIEAQVNSKALGVADVCGWTALHIAAAEGHTKTVEWLVNADADLLAVDTEGRTARETAALRGNLAAEVLLRDVERARDLKTQNPASEGGY